MVWSGFFGTTGLLLDNFPNIMIGTVMGKGSSLCVKAEEFWDSAL